LVRDPFIEELAWVLHIEAKGGNLTGAVANAAVTLLCPHLLRSYSSRSEQLAYPKGVLGPARERRIRNHIENALDQDLSISALARIVRLAPEHFAVLFRNSTGFTPHQYVNHRRVAEAQRLLADEDLTLAEISYRCGFSCQSQFTTTFRRYAGVTPGKFRHSLVVPTKT
jgi:AraC family transcriptional regulator